MSFVDENDVSLRLTVRRGDVSCESQSQHVRGARCVERWFRAVVAIFSGQWALCFNLIKRVEKK